MAAGEHHLFHMLQVANASGDDLGFDAIKLEGLDDIIHQLHAIFSDIVQATDKGADKGSAGTSG